MLEIACTRPQAAQEQKLSDCGCEEYTGSLYGCSALEIIEQDEMYGGRGCVLKEQVVLKDDYLVPVSSCHANIR